MDSRHETRAKIISVNYRRIYKNSACAEFFLDLIPSARIKIVLRNEFSPDSDTRGVKGRIKTMSYKDVSESSLLYVLVIASLVIIAAISVCYNVFRSNFFVAQMLSGMQAGVGAVIASVTYDMGAPIVKEKDPMSLVIMLGAFLAACILEINVVYIVIVCGLIGLVRTLLSKRRSGK